MSKKLAAQNSTNPTTIPGSSFVRTCFHILFFVTPLLLWPYTTEVFEFNKMIFVYLMTTVITSGWLIHIFKTKKLELVRTTLDIPLLLFFLSQLISTVVSIDPHTSLWGYYSRFHGGLISTISYILLFYAFVNNFKNNTQAIRKIIKTILATATITAIYAVLEHFGIDKHVWVQDVQSRVFSTLGQPNWLSAYLIALLPISLYLSLDKKNKGHFFFLIPSALFLISIIYTKSQSGIGATAITLLLFVFFIAKQQKNKTIIWIIIPLLLLGIFFKKDFAIRTLNSLNKINPFFSDTQTILSKENETRIGGSDSMTIRRIVWEGAIKLGQRYPFFGSGVETFGYSYYNVRPATHNFTSETDFLYNKAHNEYLNFLATSGFVGLATYLYLIFSTIISFRTATQNPENSNLGTPLLLGYISILITNYFGFSVVNIGLFFFLFPAFIISQNKNSTKEIKIKIKSILPILITIILAIFCLNKVKNIWLADVYYGKGKSNLQANEMAIKLNPSEPLYTSQLGLIQSVVAAQIIYPQMNTLATAEADLKEKATTYLNQYINDSLKNTQKSVEMNPYNLNLYKNKARTELTLATLDPQYNNLAVNTLLKIIELSPTDPANYVNLGVLYASQNKTDSARQAFLKALDLNPNQVQAKAHLNNLKDK